MTPVLRLAAFTALGLPGLALAQDFNAAPPNAPDQVPAFQGQTRAPVLAPDVTLAQEVIADLDSPWGMDQLPDGSWIVTERPGTMRIVGADGSLSDPIAGIPAVDSRGQGGLLDVAVRDFDTERRVWWSYAEPQGDGTNATAVATGTLSDDGSTMQDVAVIFRQTPAWDSTLHFGSRLVFAPNGDLFVTLGERSVAEARPFAQDLTSTLGKVVRLNAGGGPSPENPQIEGALPEIWSYGHRNVQSAAIGPDGALWTVEHGTNGGDELNRPEAGLNYGWPVQAYGIEYSGDAIPGAAPAVEGMEQPLYYWDPVIAPSGMVFYDGDLFPWQGDALIGGLRGMALVRLELDGTAVTGEARYLQDQARIRDVDVAADGSVMILTDGADGQLIRLTPEG